MRRLIMKTTGLGARGKGRIRAVVHRGTRTRKGAPTPPVHREFHDPTICPGCGAVFHLKTWRRTWKRQMHAGLAGAQQTVCPACDQVRGGNALGRVLLRGTYVDAHADEIRRRVLNVARRASHTQPERKLISWRKAEDGIEITTTSQELGHRIVRELEKAFHGTVTYAWTDRRGELRATWEREEAASRT
jgi:NMD protein affecting ribosome stability and mRNA decay